VVKPIEASAKALAKATGIKQYPGYGGMFTRRQATGAITNGTRIVKVKTEDGDTHPVGSEGAVLGSIGSRSLGIMYFVEWDAAPSVAVAVIAWKIAAKV